MKNWSNSLFPLVILIALAGLTFWLRYASQLDEPTRDGKTRHDPDYIVSDAVLRKISENGQLQYTLRASDIRHYPDNDTTDVLMPNLEHVNPGRPIVTMSAKRGHISAKGEQVDLYDDVRIVRAGDAKRAPLHASMPQLTVFPDAEKAFTKSNVLITQGKSWAKGLGMQVDQRLQTYVIESQARASFERRSPK